MKDIININSNKYWNTNYLLFTNFNPESKVSYYHEVYNNVNINTNKPNPKLLNNEFNFQDEETNIDTIIKNEFRTEVEINEHANDKDIVVMVNLGCRLKLKQIVLCPNSEFNSEINALKIRINEPESYALIFRSGKMICYGTKNKQDAKMSAKTFALIIKRLGFDVKFKNYKIINNAGIYNRKFNIELNELKERINLAFNNSDEKLSHYEPENFPGLIYHMNEPKLTLIIFNSGKLFFLGAKKHNIRKEARKKIYELFKDNKNESQNAHEYSLI